MYQVQVVSDEFKGRTLVEQHKLVGEVWFETIFGSLVDIILLNKIYSCFKVLKNEVKEMHGIRIFTQVPKDL